MTITLNRTGQFGEYLDGILLIDDIKVCDTAENALTCIPAGIYDIKRKRCKQQEHVRFVPVVKVFDKMFPCKECRQLEYAGPDTILPCYCPQLKVGSGVHNREDGRIIIGTKVVEGVVEHSQETFDLISERIRKSMARGHSVTLIINDIPNE